MTKGTALTLEVFATLAAAFEDPFVDRDSLMKHAALDGNKWESGRRALQQRMADEPDLARQFADRFQSVRAALTGGADPRDLLSPRETKREHEQQPVNTVVASQVAERTYSIEEAPRIVLAAPSSIDTTGELGPIDLGPAVPFSGAATPPPAVGASAQSGDTAFVQLADLGLAMPSASGDVDVTAAPERYDPGVELPFRGDSARPVPSAQLPRHAEAGQTKFTSSVNLDATLPFTGLSAADMYADHMMVAAPLTLAQFASVMVEIEKTPARHHEILTRYSITAEILAALDRELKVLCDQDSDAGQAWKALQRKYAKWLAAQSPADE